MRGPGFMLLPVKKISVSINDCMYQNRQRLSPLIFILLILLPVIAQANVTQSNVSQRQQFLEAEAALEAGNVQLFEELSYKNRNYVLYPYLRYYDLSKRLKAADEKEVDQFLSLYADYPFAYAIRINWLSHLAKERNWRLYRKYYKGQSSTVYKCHNLTASLAGKLSKKQLQSVLSKGEKLWLSDKKDKKECKPIFEALHSYGKITTALRWQRIELAMKAGNLKLATSLSKPFGSRDKRLIKLWKKVYRKPHKVFAFKQMRRNGLIKRKIIYQAIQRVAKNDVDKANELWRKAKRRFPFNAELKQKMIRYLAIHAAFQSKSNALKLLKRVPKKMANRSVQQLRVRVALKEQKWNELISAINAVNSTERKQVRWKYWQARAWEQLGKTKRANSIFEGIATETNYYGFLAADRVKKPYRFTSEPLRRDEAALEVLKQIPAILRTEELYALDRITEARREWNRVIRTLDENRTKLAAILAHEWEWHDNAIFTVAKTRHRKDLDLRFPTPYRDLIFNTAENYGLDPEWIYGVARRESAFNVVARSSAGAMGLMQILPSTARIQSKSLGLGSPSYSDLLNSDRNILLGSSYLNKMLKRFSGNQVIATAAYNAGPNRVSKWLPKQGNKISPDVWVDTIPYKETREYVRAVMAYATIFDWKLNQSITPLRERMKISF